MVQFFTSARGVGISPEQGAIPAVWLASEAETEGGGYYMRKTRLQAAPVASELKRINDFWDAWFSLYEKRKKSS